MVVGRTNWLWLPRPYQSLYFKDQKGCVCLMTGKRNDPNDHKYLEYNENRGVKYHVLPKEFVLNVTEKKT